MPTTTTPGGVELYYDVEGTGDAVAFVDDAGYGAWQWGWQHPRVVGPYRALVWDLRGTGRSDAPPGPYDVDTMARDLEAVLSAAGVGTAHLVGAGLGGMVALEYAGRYTRAETLTLFNTAASGENVDETALRDLHPPGNERASVRASLAGAFSEAFRSSAPELVERVVDWRLEEDAAETPLEAQIAATSSFESGPLYELALPALVCHGLENPVVPVDAGRRLAADLPRGTFEAVEGRHLCHVEHSRAVTDRMLAFFEERGE